MLASLPFTFFISNEALYFGVLPIVAGLALGLFPLQRSGF
jgi:Mg2+/citrate symporter